MEGPTVREQILAAAVDTAAAHGLARLSVGDVAKRAGLSRQTIYRHFPSKDALISATVGHETAGLIGQVVVANSALDDPREALAAAFATALRAAREHPLLDRLLRTEPEALLPLLTTDGGPAMNQVRSVVESVIGARQPDVDPVQLRRFADIVTRLLVSYAVSAPDESPDVVAESVAAVLFDGASSFIDLSAPEVTA